MQFDYRGSDCGFAASPQITARAAHTITLASERACMQFSHSTHAHEREMLLINNDYRLRSPKGEAREEALLQSQ